MTRIVVFAFAAGTPALADAQSPPPAPSPSPSAAPAVAAGPISISMAYKGPPGWRTVSAMGTTSFVIQDGDKVHAIAFASVNPVKVGTALEPFVTDRIAAERQKGAEVTDLGPTTTCEGQPAHRWTVVSASTGVTMETKVLATVVTGGLATATYIHRQGIGDRRDALDAMDTLCPGPFGNPVPAGWTAPKTTALARAQFLTLDSPDATSTFVATFRLIAADRFAAFEQDGMPRGSVIADRRETCGAGQVRLSDVRVGGQIAQVATAYLHHVAYRYVYTRPAEHEVDQGAERALTAFCRAASPLAAPGTTPI